MKDLTGARAAKPSSGLARDDFKGKAQPARGTGMARLLADVRMCRICSEHLPLGPRPVLRASPGARILVAGQAPGRRVHETGLPFNDPSGDRLREWMGVTREVFYDARRIAIVPMGFCYPGTGPSGDLPPRPECAAAWRAPLMAALRNIELILAIGQYAVAWHVPRRRRTLTDTVRAWREWGPGLVPLPHPSPRNNRWFKLNPWFERETVPFVRRRVAEILRKSGGL